MSAPSSSIIPASHSLLDAKALGLLVERSFEIGAVRDCRLWRSFLNDVFRVQVGNQSWWLRVHPIDWRTREQTQIEVDAVTALRQDGAAVAAAISGRSGNRLLTIEAPEGIRTAVLFEDAAGLELDYFGPDGLRNATRYGRATAELHDACDRITMDQAYESIDLASTVLRPCELVAAYLNQSDRDDLERICARMIDHIDQYEALTSAFCHGDLNGSNIHFDLEAATVFDFDCCGWGWRTFELAAFARGVTWYGGPGATTQSLCKAFLEGYRSRRPLTDEDLALQPTMLLAQRLWVTALHLKSAVRLGSFYFGNDYAAKFVRWLRAWETTLSAAPRRIRLTTRR